MSDNDTLYYQMLEAEDKVTLLLGALEAAFKSFIRNPSNPDDLISMLWDYYIAVDEYEDLRQEYEKATKEEE